MQFNVTRSIADLKKDFKARVRELSQKKIAAIYDDVDQLDSTIKAFELIASGQTASTAWTNLQATWSDVKFIRNAEKTAISSINGATTVQAMRDAVQVFKSAVG